MKNRFGGSFAIVVPSRVEDLDCLTGVNNPGGDIRCVSSGPLPVD